MGTRAAGRGLFGGGKVILFGEHAAVFGQPALAAALNIGIRVDHVSEKIDGEKMCVDVVPWSTRTRPGDGTQMGAALSAILSAVEAECGPVAPASIVLKCTVPAGAGLGSSAALAVVLARQLIALASNPPEDPGALVLSAAAAAESVFHGTPSGVDHTTSAIGGVIRFEKGADPPYRRLDIEPIALLIGHMSKGADTGEMVAGVRRLKEAEPALIDPLIELMGQITGEAEIALRVGDGPRVGRLMNIAHGALSSLGVSTGPLDRGCHAARKAGAWGAKLTGAGGGGCIIALADEAAKMKVIQALQNAGAERVISVKAGVTPT